MSTPEQSHERRLLLELSQINNDYGLRQRQAMQELARSRHELAEARGVLGTVAHDLRTPLQAVIGFAEFLLSDDLAPEHRELAERIVHSGKVMAELTDELLASVAGREAAPTRDRVDIGSLVTELTSRYALLTSPAEHTILAEVSGPDELVVEGDATKLRRALENLITNAVKFSPSGETVRISAALHGTTVEVRVEDNGPGIDPAEHEALFTPFYRAAGSETVPGTGLGLTIVQQVAEAHGGTIAVESRLGEGTTFVLRLPSGSA